MKKTHVSSLDWFVLSLTCSISRSVDYQLSSAASSLPINWRLLSAIIRERPTNQPITEFIPGTAAAYKACRARDRQTRIPKYQRPEGRPFSLVGAGTETQSITTG